MIKSLPITEEYIMAHEERWTPRLLIDGMLSFSSFGMLGLTRAEGLKAISKLSSTLV